MVLEWSHNTWLWYLIGNPIYIIHKSDISPNFVKVCRLGYSARICALMFISGYPGRLWPCLHMHSSNQNHKQMVEISTEYKTHYTNIINRKTELGFYHTEIRF